jgi:hypothetical protein
LDARIKSAHDEAESAAFMFGRPLRAGRSLAAANGASFFAKNSRIEQRSRRADGQQFSF